MSEFPRTLGLGNVVLDGFTSNITNTPKEFSWTPEMAFSKISSQPIMLLKDSISRIPFEELQGFRDTHGMWHFNKEMYVVWLNADFIDFKPIFSGNLSKRSFTKFFDLFKLERVPSIFAFPNKVKCILSNRVLEVCKFHFFSSYAKFKNIVHTTTNTIVECANSIAHFFYSFKNLRRFGLPRAEALGILYM